MKKSRTRKHPSGKSIANPDMLGRVLGHADVFKDLKFISIQTMSFEQNKATQSCINDGGAVIFSDVS